VRKMGLGKYLAASLISFVPVFSGCGNECLFDSSDPREGVYELAFSDGKDGLAVLEDGKLIINRQKINGIRDDGTYGEKWRESTSMKKNKTKR